MKSQEVFAAIIFTTVFNDYEIEEIESDALNDFRAWNAIRKIELEVKSDINEEYRRTVVSAGHASNQLRSMYPALPGALYMTLSENGRINSIKEQIQDLINVLPSQKIVLGSDDFKTYSKTGWLNAENLREDQKIKISIAQLPITEHLEMLYFDPSTKSDLAIIAPLRISTGAADSRVFIDWLNSRISDVTADHAQIVDRATFDPFLYFTIDSFESIEASEFLARGDATTLSYPNLPEGYKGLVIAGVDGDGKISGLWFDENGWSLHKSEIQAAGYLMEKFKNFDD
jgi:hypothetical protein